MGYCVLFGIFLAGLAKLTAARQMFTPTAEARRSSVQHQGILSLMTITSTYDQDILRPRASNSATDFCRYESLRSSKSRGTFS